MGKTDHIKVSGKGSNWKALLETRVESAWLQRIKLKYK